MFKGLSVKSRPPSPPPITHLKVGDNLALLGDMATRKKFPLDDGGTITLATAYAQGKALVLFFYPKASTPTCTAEACSFRDSYAEFEQAGAMVLGISSDGPEANARWKKQHRLPFPLATDEKGELRKALGVAPSMWILPGRETFVFDKKGKLLMRFNSQMDSQKHVDNALEALEKP